VLRSRPEAFDVRGYGAYGRAADWSRVRAKAPLGDALDPRTTANPAGTAVAARGQNWRKFPMSNESNKGEGAAQQVGVGQSDYAAAPTIPQQRNNDYGRRLDPDASSGRITRAILMPSKSVVLAK